MKKTKARNNSMIVRKATPEEQQRVNELFSIAFELPLETGPAQPDSDGRLHFWAAYEDGTDEMMSTFTITDFNIHFDGHSCKMGGIGGVATLPQYRRMGGIRGCFQQALPDMYANGYDFSYLYPFSTAYYRKFGYENCVRRYHTTVMLSMLKPPAVSGCAKLADSGRNDLKPAIRAVDAVLEDRYNMMVRHSLSDYGWVDKCSPAAKQEFTYVYFAGDGTPKAYTTFRMVVEPDGRNLVCNRFAFVDAEGYNGLMHVFQSMAADHQFVKFDIPSNPSTGYLMPEWSMGAAQWALWGAGMVRVVNVESVLKKAKYLGSGDVVLNIQDPQIPENTGRFRVEFRDGAAQSVTRTEAPADASMRINVFSALISGVSDLASAISYMPDLTVFGKEETLSKVFYPKPLMIADYF